VDRALDQKTGRLSPTLGDVQALVLEREGAVEGWGYSDGSYCTRLVVNERVEIHVSEKQTKDGYLLTRSSKWGGRIALLLQPSMWYRDAVGR